MLLEAQYSFLYVDSVVNNPNQSFTVQWQLDC